MFIILYHRWNAEPKHSICNIAWLWIWDRRLEKDRGGFESGITHFFYYFLWAMGSSCTWLQAILGEAGKGTHIRWWPAVQTCCKCSSENGRYGIHLIRFMTSLILELYEMVFCLIAILFVVAHIPSCTSNMIITSSFKICVIHVCITQIKCTNIAIWSIKPSSQVCNGTSHIVPCQHCFTAPRDKTHIWNTKWWNNEIAFIDQ